MSVYSGLHSYPTGVLSEPADVIWQLKVTRLLRVFVSAGVQQRQHSKLWQWRRRRRRRWRRQWRIFSVDWLTRSTRTSQHTTQHTPTDTSNQ